MVGAGQAAREGIYIRNEESLETAAKLNVIVFDKTGTITEGKPKVTDLLKLSRMSEEKIIRLAASAENNSEHFLGRAIVAHAGEQSIELEECTHFVSETGRGIAAGVGGKKLLLGNKAWLMEQGIDAEGLLLAAGEFSVQGKTPVFMAVDGARRRRCSASPTNPDHKPRGRFNT